MSSNQERRPDPPSDERRNEQPGTSAGGTTVYAEHAYFGEVNQYIHHQDRHRSFDIVEINQLDEKLRQSLKENIDVVFGSQRIEPVLLDVIHTKQKTKEEFGISGGLLRHKHVTSDATFLNVENIFPAAKRNAQTQSELKCNNQPAKLKFIQKHGNIVGVVGIAGIGKSTFGKQVLQFIKSTKGANDDCYLFLIFLRDFDFSIPISTLQFLLRSSLPEWEHSPESDKQLLKRISKSSNTFIVFDGLDEARLPNLSQAPSAIGLFDSATPDVIFKNIQNGHVLPNAHKMLISRPGSYDDLYHLCKPIFTGCVVGLGEESQDLLIQRNLQNEEERDKVRNALEVNPSAKGLCFLPVFANLVMSYAQHSDADMEDFSITDVFTSFVIHCFQHSHSVLEPNDLLKLSQLALNGMLYNKLVFKSGDLKACGVNAKVWEDFINLQWRFGGLHARILEGNKSYFFSHLLWQEYFTSLHLMFVTEMDGFIGILEVLEEKEWEMVLRFLFGLMNPKVLGKLISVIPSLDTDDFEAKKTLLMEMFNRKISEYKNSCFSDYPVDIDLCFDSESIDVLQVFKSRNNNDSLFTLCSLAHESRCGEFTKSISGFLPKMILISGVIFPSHVASLCYVLRATDRQLSINVGVSMEPATFTENGLLHFLDGISTTRHQVTKFGIENTNITSHVIDKIVPHVPYTKELLLAFCDLSRESIRKVLDRIKLRPNPIDLLDLTGHDLGDACVTLLCQCIEKIERLDLDRCNITENQVECLATKLLECKVAIKSLNLRRNKIGSCGFEIVAPVVHKIERLELTDCDMNDDDLVKLSSAIANLQHPIKWLILGNNSFGSRGLESLSFCVSNIEILRLGNCGIVGIDLGDLTRAIAKLKKPMRMIDLSGNAIGSRGVEFISHCAHNIEDLRLENCDITESGLKHLTNAIAKLKKPMKVLVVGNNPLGDEGGELLASCAHKIERLSCGDCGISNDVMQIIQLRLNAVAQETEIPDRIRNKKKCEIM